MARVQLTADARADFRNLDGSTRKIVAKALKKLETEPDRRGQPLGRRGSGDLTTFRKLVVGDRDHRIVYRIDPDGTVVVVWVIAPRADGEAYDLAMGRLRRHRDAGVRELAAGLEQIWDR